MPEEYYIIGGSTVTVVYPRGMEVECCGSRYHGWEITVKPKKPKLPRVPLPRQTGGAHKVKTKVLDRKRKHKKQED